MKKVFTCFFSLALFWQVNAQQALDFTFTDINGVTHRLQNALDQGFIVMIDFFFVNCPPCQASSPEIQAIHEDYQGKNVLVWSISDRDNNPAIVTFKQNLGLTFTAGGLQGGGNNVVNAYAAGFPFTGFPTISVVCPDRSISWDIWPYSAGAPQWRNAINACGVVDHAPYVPSLTAVDEIGALNAPLLSPNPALESTRLTYSLREAQQMQIDLLNAQGQLLRQVFSGRLEAGDQQLDIALAGLPAGAYFVRFQNTLGEVHTLSLHKR